MRYYTVVFSNLTPREIRVPEEDADGTPRHLSFVSWFAESFYKPGEHGEIEIFEPGKIGSIKIKC